MADARPPILQLVLAGFATLAVAFTGVATVVAVATGPDTPGRGTPVPASPRLVDRGSESINSADAATGARWSTVRVAQEIGALRLTHLTRS